MFNIINSGKRLLKMFFMDTIKNINNNKINFNVFFVAVYLNKLFWIANHFCEKCFHEFAKLFFQEMDPIQGVTPDSPRRERKPRDGDECQEKQQVNMKNRY